jgi:hypothetical protein
MADETMAGIGAILAGRRWYDLAMEPWEGVDGIYGGNYEGRVFVLTHRPPDDGGDPRISFISDGIEGRSRRPKPPPETETLASSAPA